MSKDALAAIRTQVMWNRLIAVVEEQAQSLLRTAFGTITREAGDLSARDEFQIVDQPGHAWIIAIRLARLQRQTFRKRACANPGRVERLDERQGQPEDSLAVQGSGDHVRSFRFSGLSINPRRPEFAFGSTETPADRDDKDLITTIGKDSQLYLQAMIARNRPP